jgi:hypothetical protein
MVFPNKAFKAKSFNSLWNFNQFNIHDSYFILFSHSQVLGCDTVMATSAASTLGSVAMAAARCSPSAPEEGFRLGAGKISQCLAGVRVVLAPLPGGAGNKRGGQPAGSTVSQRQCKPRPNLDGVCIAADWPIKIRRAIGLGFSNLRLKSDRFEHPTSICVGPLEMPLCSLSSSSDLDSRRYSHPGQRPAIWISNGSCLVWYELQSHLE